MFQILRSYKFEHYVFLRCYGNQSKYPTHYDTLRIPQTSSQKEIREAFIKLSKEMHPDIKGRRGHSEFVKVNEAYKVLSKEHLRSQYDMDIKYESYSENSSYAPYSSYPSHPYQTKRSPNGFEYYRHNPQKTSRSNWEEYINSQNTDEYYSIKGIKRIRNIWIVFICVTMALASFIVQLLLINKSVMMNKEIIMMRNSQYQRDYKKAQDAVEGKHVNEQIQSFEWKVQNSRPSDRIKKIRKYSVR